MIDDEEYKYFEDGSKMTITKWNQIQLDIELLEYKLKQTKVNVSGSNN